MNIFEVENLCIFIDGPFGKKCVVEDVSFTLKQGTIHGLVGQSGAGKTMTANALTGLLSRPAEITGGIIRIGGHEFGITDKRVWNRIRGQKIFMIFQCAAQALNPSVKVGIQIAEVLENREGLSRKKNFSLVGKLLEKVGLDYETMHKYPFQLSGGMRQRIQIAIALALKPDILIADEPTTGLDSITQMDILTLLSELKDDHGMTILFISHDLHAVSCFAQTVSVMHQGRLVETGTVDDIFKFPRNRYTKELIGKLKEMENMTWQNICWS